MFTDRKDAAEKLAFALEEYRDKHALVLGIPRGGVVTAYYVAQYLNAALSLVVTRKLGYPSNPEAAFGAVAEDGSIYLSDQAMQELTREEMKAVLSRQRHEIQLRLQKLRRGKPLPDMTGRTVIIVDDGIATGATLFATIRLCKNKKAGKIVVASPLSGREMENTLRSMVDDVVILETPTFFYAVSQGYEDFRTVTDEAALALMNRWAKEHPVQAS